MALWWFGFCEGGYDNHPKEHDGHHDNKFDCCLVFVVFLLLVIPTELSFTNFNGVYVVYVTMVFTFFKFC